MSYPDQTPPSYPFISPSGPSYAGGDGGGYWPGFWMGNDQPQPQPDMMSSQFDRPQFKKPRISEKPSNFAPFPSLNPRINPPNVLGGKGTSHIFYKTRMCAKFIEGTCRNGDQCTFAHGAEDLREPPPNWQELIREKDRGSGSGNWGDDQRMMIHRMKICKKYYNGEECPYGDKCNFLHERPSSPPAKKFKVDMPEQRESSAISIGTTGDVRGSSIDFDQSKVYWKTKMCSKWEMGQCPFGERCHFAHGHSELKFYGPLDESEPATDAISFPRKPPTVVPAFTAAPANLVASAPPNGDEEHKKLSKWKVTRKINRIYADWLDDLTPPDCSPSKEDM